jgi:hypothetical protein
MKISKLVINLALSICLFFSINSFSGDPTGGNVLDMGSIPVESDVKMISLLEPTNNVKVERSTKMMKCHPHTFDICVPSQIPTVTINMEFEAKGCQDRIELRLKASTKTITQFIYEENGTEFKVVEKIPTLTVRAFNMHSKLSDSVKCKALPLERTIVEVEVSKWAGFTQADLVKDLEVKFLP